MCPAAHTDWPSTGPTSGSLWTEGWKSCGPAMVQIWANSLPPPALQEWPLTAQISGWRWVSVTRSLSSKKWEHRARRDFLLRDYEYSRRGFEDMKRSGVAWVFRLLLMVPAFLQLNSQVSVTTWHNDNWRTGENTNETQLSINSINTQGFGRLCQIPLPSTP